MAVVRRAKTMREVLRGSGASPSSEMSKVIAELRKQHGNKTLVAGNAIRQPWRIPTGVFTLDLATLGGVPHDRVTMIHGKKHSGKSMMSDRIIMGAQQTMPSQQVVKIDTEGTHDEVWSSKIGVDTASLLVSQPDSGEQAVDIAVALAQTWEVSLIVVDSLAALVPIKEQEEDADKALVGLQSKMITSMMRKLTAAQIKERKRGHHVTVVVLNQQRSQIGGWSPNPAAAITLPGGKALGHFTSLEIHMKNKETVEKDEAGGSTLSVNDHAFTIDKNKLGAGYRTGEFRMMRREDPATGLTEGEIDDAPIMLSYAKMAGWYTGTPKAGYTLEFGDYEPVRVAKAEDMIRTLYGDREYMWALRCHLIANQAKRQGMPQWYLDYLVSGDMVDE